MMLVKTREPQNKDNFKAPPSLSVGVHKERTKTKGFEMAAGVDKKMCERETRTRV